MKLRLGFVSNSSSSSWCLVGVLVDPAQFTQRDKYINLLHDAGCPDDEFEGNNIDCILYLLWNWLSLEDAHKVFGKLSVQQGLDTYADDEYIIGRSIDLLKDDQTLGDFKRAVFEELKKLGFTGTVDDIGVHVDGGYPT